MKIHILKKHSYQNILALTAITISLNVSTTHSAERRYLGGNNLVSSTLLQNKQSSPLAKQSPTQLLGLSSNETLEVKRTYTDINGDETIRYRQIYKGVPVIGDDIIIRTNSNRVFKSTHGAALYGISNDLIDVTPKISKNRAMTIAKKRSLPSKIGEEIAYENEKSQLAVWNDDSNTARLVYEIDFVQYADTASRPHYLIDANTGKVLKYYDNLKHAHATGPGGNDKTGIYYYGEDYGYLNVTQKNDTCIMENADIKTVDLSNAGIITTSSSIPYSFACSDNTGKAVNGAYSPLNDAHYYGGVVIDMYKEWFSMKPLPFQLVLGVHYKYEFTSAFWTGTGAVFGDGNSKYYPLVSLDIVSHEIAHGFTEQHSGLVYEFKQAGLDEAFSDMAGQAAVYYLRGRNNWKVGEDYTKGSGAGRYMYNPPLDGSIDNQSDYTPFLSQYQSSGVYNKAFYNLAITPDWNTRKAFEVYVRANMLYWTANIDWDEAGNGVLNAACDLGYDTKAVKTSLSLVGINSSLDSGRNCSTKTST